MGGKTQMKAGLIWPDLSGESNSVGGVPGVRVEPATRWPPTAPSDGRGCEIACIQEVKALEVPHLFR